MLRNTLYTLLGTIYMVAVFFKIMHWPGPREIFIASLAVMGIALVEFLVRKRETKLLLREIIYVLLGIVLALGLAFILIHWPLGGEFLIVSLFGFSAALVHFGYRMRSSVLAIIPVLSAIVLFFSVFKISHWPIPFDLLTISIICFDIAFVILLLVRAYQLKQTEPNLKVQYIALVSLSVISILLHRCIIPFSEGMDKVLALAHFGLMVIIAISILVIVKAIKEDNLNVRLPNDYKLLQCLGAIFMIELLFQGLVSY